MANRVKVAVFDFCGTFVNFQTGDAFIRYVSKDIGDVKKIHKSEAILSFCVKSKFCAIWDRLFKNSLSKRIIAKQISGISLDAVAKKASEFYDLFIKPNIVSVTQELFKKSKKDGCYTILVSAAYSIYLEFFNKDFGFDAIISSSLKNKNGKMTGSLEKDVYGRKKVKYLKQFLDRKFGKSGYDIVLSVGDSKSDIPVLDIAYKKIVVTNKKTDWIKDNYEVCYYGN